MMDPDQSRVEYVMHETSTIEVYDMHPAYQDTVGFVCFSHGGPGWRFNQYLSERALDDLISALILVREHARTRR